MNAYTSHIICGHSIWSRGETFLLCIQKKSTLENIVKDRSEICVIGSDWFRLDFFNNAKKEMPRKIHCVYMYIDKFFSISINFGLLSLIIQCTELIKKPTEILRILLTIMIIIPKIIEIVHNLYFQNYFGLLYLLLKENEY